MRLTPMFIVAVVSLVGCEKPPPRITAGPFTGYDFDPQSSDRDAVDDTGVYAVKRLMRRSRVGSSTEYFTVTWDLENQSDFWFCVDLHVEPATSGTTTWGSGLVSLAPHSTSAFVAGIGADSSSTSSIKYEFKPRAWPADREGACRADDHK